MSEIKKLLSSLEIDAINPGGGIGGTLFSNENNKLLTSFSPIDNQCIASVKTCGAAEYAILIEKAKKNGLEAIPTDKAIVTETGKPSGIALTAKPIAVNNISEAAMPCKKPMIKIKTTILLIAILNFFPNVLICFSKGLSVNSDCTIDFVIFPISVFFPTPTIIAFPLPFNTILLANNILYCSPSGISFSESCSLDLSTGNVSPVNIASSIDNP